MTIRIYRGNESTSTRYCALLLVSTLEYDRRFEIRRANTPIGRLMCANTHTQPDSEYTPDPRGTTRLDYEAAWARKKWTLHEEIRDILESKENRWMTTSELADRVNHRCRYRNRDGSSVSRVQIHDRTRNHSRWFERKKTFVRVIPALAVVATSVDPKGLNSVPGLRQQGFEGFLKVRELRQAPRNPVPAEPGVYLFLHTLAAAPEFLIEGTGGRFKNRDPNVSPERLRKEWVEGALIVYVGQSGTAAVNAVFGEALKANDPAKVAQAASGYAREEIEPSSGGGAELERKPDRQVAEWGAELETVNRPEPGTVREADADTTGRTSRSRWT